MFKTRQEASAQRAMDPQQGEAEREPPFLSASILARHLHAPITSLPRACGTSVMYPTINLSRDFLTPAWTICCIALIPPSLCAIVRKKRGGFFCLSLSHRASLGTSGYRWSSQHSAVCSGITQGQLFPQNAVSLGV